MFQTMPVYFGTVMWDIGFPSIISAFSLVQLAFFHLTQVSQISSDNNV